MTIRQFFDRLAYTTVNTIAIAVLFVSGVTYAEIEYADSHVPVVDGQRAR